MTPRESREQPRLRFTIRGLLILTLGLAVGAADQNWRQGAWLDRTRSLLLVASVWMIVGLLQQAWRASRARPAGSAPNSVPFSLWEVARPCGLAALLIYYHFVEHEDARRLSADHALVEHRWWIDGVYVLTMAAVLIEIIQHTFSPPRRLPPFFFVPAWALGIVFATLACYERLVQVAGAVGPTGGGDQPSRRALRLESFEIGEPTFWLGLSLAAWVPAGVASLYFVARGSRRRGRRIGYAAVFAAAVLGMVASLAVNAGLAGIATRRLISSPDGAPALAHLARIIVPGGLVLLAALAANWSRFWAPIAAERQPIRSPEEVGDSSDLPLHWRPLVLALVAVAIALEVVFVAARTVVEFNQSGMPIDALSLLAVLFTYESTLPLAVLAGLAAAAAWQARRGMRPDPRPQRLPAGRFAFFALASALVSALAVGVLTLYGFALRLAR